MNANDCFIAAVAQSCDLGMNKMSVTMLMGR